MVACQRLLGQIWEAEREGWVLRAHASVSPWLPILEPYLDHLVLLGGRASELYHLALMERRAPSHPESWTYWGVDRGGSHPPGLAEHLARQGFKKRTADTPSAFQGPAFQRADLGWIQFLCPKVRGHQKPSARGLGAVPETYVHLELEEPHPVEVTYLGKPYEVRIPAAGRFALAHALRLPPGDRTPSEALYAAARSLGWLLELLAQNQELEEEALGELLEVRPPVLLRDFRERLRRHGPGSALWSSALKLLESSGSGVKTVALESWYWKFLPKLVKLEEERRRPDEA
jgi:hypothetical protein